MDTKDQREGQYELKTFKIGGIGATGSRKASKEEIEYTLGQADGVKQVSVDVDNSEVSVNYDVTIIQERDLRGILSASGYYVYDVKD